MQAVRFHEFGSPSVLVLEEVDLPVPGPGEVRVRVAATSFNGIDGNIRAGAMTGPFPVSLPHVPGVDVAGTVDAVGDGVTGRQVGEAVVGFVPMVPDGAAAEFVVVPAEVLVAAPTAVPLADAAALPLVGLTAWQALFDHGALTAGQRVLVTGAGGAVGGYAVQLAVAAGAQVVATASARTAAAVRALGAIHVLDPAADLAIDLGDPVDLVLNLAPVEPGQLAAMAALVRPGGAVVSTTVWMPAPSDPERGVRGVDVFVRSDAGQLAELVARVDRGELRVDVADRVPLAELAGVHRRAAEGRLPGKTVVLIEER
ncbi:NADP-dependent oxidoreductase [Klenkia sp. LSe6-5]|uniref:NADP-dependent oxidoreductase n=1 Tax=Klenkia sesuvii TaxID=3103137 RepID=A0ABU8DWJ1_9ACTN